MDISDLQTQIEQLEERFNELSRSNAIPRAVETAFRTRLGLGSSSEIIAGTANLSAGSVTITDSRIKTTSVCVANGQYSYLIINPFNGTIASVCNNGNAVIYSAGGASADPVNYIIFL